MMRIVQNLIVSVGLACAHAVTAAPSTLLVKDGDRVAFLGDSITELGNFPCGYVNLVMVGLRADGLTNVVKIAAGRSGDRSDRMLARIDDVLKQKPTLMFISCGVNDVWHQEHKGPDGKHTGVELPDYIRNMREMYDRCDKAGVKVGVMTATMITENAEDQKNKWLAKYNDFLRSEAKARGYLLVDCNAVMQETLAKVRAKDKTPGIKLTKDGVHMNETGEYMLASAILKGLGASKATCGSYEDGYRTLSRIGRDLPGGVTTNVRLTRREYAAFKALADQRKKRPADLGRELFVEGLEFIREKRMLPPPAPQPPTPEIPAAPAASVKVKDGEQLAFMGGYWMECASAKGYLMEQTVRGLELAGVKKPRYVPCSTRWASSAELAKHVDKVLERKTEWIVFCGEVDDYRKTPPGTLATIEANLRTAFDKLGASGRKVVLMTYPPILGPKEDISALNDFIRAEAKARGFVLADIAKAILEAKANFDYGAYEGNTAAAKALLTALGVPAATIDYVANEMQDTPGTAYLGIGTTINERKKFDDIVFAFDSNADELARDLLLAMTDEKARAAWDKMKPGPRRVLSRQDGKSFPVKDLSADKSGDVVIAAGTERDYQGHPTTVQTADGRVIAVWCTPHGGRCGPAAETADGGRTWTRIDDRFPAAFRDHGNCPSIYRLVGPDGKARIWVWSQTKRRASDNPGDVWTCRKDLTRAMPSVMSEDEGRTWKEMPMLGEKFACVMAFSSIVRLKDGSYLGMFHIGPSGADKPPLRVKQSVTKDGGFTWSDPVEICRLEGKNPCEPYVFRSPKGDELCCVIRENSRKGHSLMMFSGDEGKTWSPAVYTPWALTGDRHQGVQLKDGRLCIVFRDMAPGSPTAGHFVGWVGSYDELKSGERGSSYRIKLLHSYAGWDCGYPGIHLLKDGTLLATTYIKYWDDKRLQSVVSKRFRIAPNKKQR